MWSSVSSYSGDFVQRILCGRIADNIIVAVFHKRHKAALKQRGSIKLQAQDTNFAPPYRKLLPEPEEVSALDFTNDLVLSKSQRSTPSTAVEMLMGQTPSPQ